MTTVEEGSPGRIAQMIGGHAAGTAALAGAREMLDRVDAWRVGAGSEA